MSFFGDMLMGGLGGAGKGLENQIEADAKAATLKQAEDARLAQALQVEKMRSDDRRSNQENMMAIAGLKYGDDGEGGGGSGSSGGGSKGGGMNLMKIQMAAARSGDPKEQQLAIRLTNTYQGRDAALNLADNLFGRPVQETVSEFNPTAADILSTRAGAEANPGLSTSQSVTRNMSYDKEKGATDLQRLIVMAATNGGNSSSFSDSQRKDTLNDGAMVLGKQQLKAGYPLEDVVQGIQANSSPTLDPSKSDLGQQRIDASLSNARTKATGTRDGQVASSLKAAQARLAKARTADEFTAAQKATKAQAIAAEEANITELQAMTTAAPEVIAPLATAPRATSPSAAAAAFKNKALPGVR